MGRAIELITNEKNRVSMSQVITLTVVLVTLLIVLADVFAGRAISMTSALLLAFLALVALMNRADSRRISFKFQGMELEQDRGTNGTSHSDTT